MAAINVGSIASSLGAGGINQGMILAVLQLIVACMFLGIALIIFCVWYFYNERAVVFHRNGKVKRYRIRPYKDKQGNIRRVTLFSNIEIPAPTNDDKTYLSDGTKNTYLLYQNVAGDFHYCKLDTEDYLIGIDPQVRRLASNLRLEKMKEYESKGFWALYGNTVTGIGAVVIIMLFGWLYLQEFSNVVGQTGSIVNAINANSCASAVERIINDLPNICTQSIDSLKPVG